MKSAARRLAALLILFGLTGCATSRFAGGAFRSGDGVITCRLPASKLGPWAVEQDANATARAVEFVEDFTGAMYKIEIVDVRALPAEFQKLGTREQVMGAVNGPLFQNIRSVAPTATLLSNVYRADFRGGAAFAAYQVPGGSPMVITTGGHSSRPDTTRSVVVFRSGHWLVAATHIGGHLKAMLRPADATPPQEQTKLNLPPLIEFAKSIQIANP